MIPPRLSGGRYVSYLFRQAMWARWRPPVTATGLRLSTGARRENTAQNWPLPGDRSRNGDSRNGQPGYSCEWRGWPRRVHHDPGSPVGQEKLSCDPRPGLDFRLQFPDQHLACAMACSRSVRFLCCRLRHFHSSFPYLSRAAAGADVGIRRQFVQPRPVGIHPGSALAATGDHVTDRGHSRGCNPCSLAVRSHRRTGRSTGGSHAGGSLFVPVLACPARLLLGAFAGACRAGRGLLLRAGAHRPVRPVRKKPALTVYRVFAVCLRRFADQLLLVLRTPAASPLRWHKTEHAAHLEPSLDVWPLGARDLGGILDPGLYLLSD